MSDDKREAGCWCGAVRLEIRGDAAAMAYCHCDSCRRWFSAPVHASTLWPTPNVVITKGEDQLGTYAKTAGSQRHHCNQCGSGVLIRHPELGLTDVPAVSIEGLDFQPSIHVNYGERVMAVRDGLPKYKDFPDSFPGGSGDEIPE